MKYYISDGKQKFGPLSIEDLENYSIDENTLIWYKGLEKWKYAKNVPEILQLIKGKKQETQSDVPPRPVEKPKNKVNTLKYFVVILTIIFIAVIGFEILNKSDSKNNNIKDASEVSIEQLNKSDIINLLKDYYRVDKDRNLNKYQSYYSCPIENYFNNKYVSHKELDKMVKNSWSLTSFAKNTPDYDNLNFNYKDSIYVINYPLTYEYILKRNGEKNINTYDATIKLNDNGKIFYINNVKTSGKKIDYDFSSFKKYQGKNPINTIFKDDFFVARLEEILDSSGFNFMLENWVSSSKIFVEDNQIYAFGCKESECEDTNFIIIIDLDTNEIFVGFKHRTNKRKFKEKNGESSYLNYWYDMNEELFKNN